MQKPAKDWALIHRRVSYVYARLNRKVLLASEVYSILTSVLDKRKFRVFKLSRTEVI